jgi:hypothetical protein
MPLSLLSIIFYTQNPKLCPNILLPHFKLVAARSEESLYLSLLSTLHARTSLQFK